MNELEYLVTHGNSGDFSRFRPVPRAAYRRGDRVVVRSHQGLELGVVLCPATVDHERFLSRTALGELLRPATEEDERAADHGRSLGQRVFEDGRRLAVELSLPLEILDVEVLLDGQRAIVHHLRPVDCDYRPLVSALSRRHDVLITMENLTLPAPVGAPGGCGKPDCGKEGGGGGCTDCGSGGGCSAGSCGKATAKEDVAAYLLGLREQMLQDARTPLL
jgi:PSP1 C-terminal conserved region